MENKDAQQQEPKSGLGLLIVEGGFEDQAGELALYLERVRKQSKDKADVLTEEKLVEMLKKGQNAEIVQILTSESAALSTGAEKDFEPAYNLLIHLILTSASAETLLPQVISNLSTPPSFPQGPSLSIAILSTIFNVIPEYPSLRFQVFKAILSIAREHNLYDYVSPYFDSVNEWLDEWKVSSEERSQVWAIVISMADKAEDSELYKLLLAALSVASPSDSNALIIKTIQAAISLPQIYDLEELASLPPVRQFQADKNPAYDFLQVFLTGDLEAYRTFVKSHPSWLADNHIDQSKAERKIRLLTLATLSNTPSRTLSYSKIASSLDIPKEEVEVWLIDVIRAGLVEGKLSQARQELLVHRSTYRTFGKEEWEELDSRLEDWKVALEGVLASDQIAALREQEQPQTSAVVNGTSTSNQEVAT